MVNMKLNKKMLMTLIFNSLALPLSSAFADKHEKCSCKHDKHRASCEEGCDCKGKECDCEKCEHKEHGKKEEKKGDGHEKHGEHEGHENH